MSWPQCVITQDDGAWRCTRPATHMSAWSARKGHVIENAMCYGHLMLVLAVTPTCGQHGRRTRVASEGADLMEARTHTGVAVFPRLRARHHRAKRWTHL